MKNKIALVTGANRGMGFAVSEKMAALNYHVIMVGRNDSALKEKTSQLIAKNLSVEAFHADMKEEKDTSKLIEFVTEKYGHLDALINNAGIYIQENIFSSDENILRETMEVNTFAPFRLMKGFVPLMKKQGYGRVVNVSSGHGTIEGSSTSCPSYCVSKVSLNMLTKLFASEVSGTNVKVNSICPGWVRTDMGGASAPRSIEEGIKGTVWAATLEDDAPNGGFFRDGKPIDW